MGKDEGGAQDTARTTDSRKPYNEQIHASEHNMVEAHFQGTFSWTGQARV